MIEVLLSGIQSTYQDLGRFGYRRFGIPVSGAMDQMASTMANQLVGNLTSEPVIEFLLQGPILKFNINTEIAICGAAFSPLLNDVKIALNQKIGIKKGDVLKLGRCVHGNYGYIAVLGGFKGIEKFKSSSYYAEILPENKLKKGDLLTIKPVQQNDNQKISELTESNSELIVFPGPEFDSLNEIQQKTLFEMELTVSTEMSRMGFKLIGDDSIFAPEIVTSPVQPGTIQLTPAGQIIALMRDAQTTGGYARILQLHKDSISILAQKRTGDTVKFLTLT